MCRRLASVEKGLSPRLSLGTGIWFFSAKSISAVRLVKSHSRHGAIDLDVGRQRIIAELEADLVIALAGRAMADRVGPDLPCNLDPRLAISGRAIEVPSRYSPSYSALARIIGKT